MKLIYSYEKPIEILTMYFVNSTLINQMYVYLLLNVLGRRLRRCPEAKVALRSKRQRHARTGVQQTLPGSCWRYNWPVTASATTADSSHHYHC